MNTDGHQCFPAEPPSKQGLYDPRAESDACGVGFVVHQKGRKSHDIVAKALQVLINLEHRGACGCEANTGDGAGILIQTPDAFLRAVVPFSLPAPGAYAAGLVFLPHEERDRETIKSLIGRITEEEGQRLLGWRDVPTDDRLVGPSARAAQPVFEQVFIGAGGGLAGADAAARFERKLYVIRKRVERAVDALKINALARRAFYVVSLSANTLIYKGMLTAQQLGPMFPDLLDERFESALALVHQRFSTNTFPSWPLAHPYRMIAHNGEINTLRGNINWMRAREGLLQSDLLGDDLKKLLPVIREGGSDTATFDNVLELLVMAGRSLPHAILMMIPEPWSGNEEMAADRKAFYEYHSSLMEPWDGPASIAFTDGTVIGAVLDRNGLRPSRYYVTKDDLVIMASEVGVLDIPPADVLVKERLHPGKIFLVDTAKGRIVDDEEIKSQLAAEHPYREWIDSQLYDINELPAGAAPSAPEHETVFDRQQTFGYTQEDLRLLIGPMAAERRGADRLDGHRRGAGRAVGEAAPALRVLQAALRAGHQSAARRHPRGAGDVDGLDDRAGAQPAQAGARVVPADPHQVPDHPQRARRQAAQPAARRAVPLDDAVDAVRSVHRRRGPGQGDGRPVPPRQRGGEERLRHPHPVGPRRQPRPGADSEPAGHGRRAPPPGARGHADAVRAGRRIGRRARSAPRGAAHRLRRRRGQSLRGVRDHRRHDPAGHAGRHRAREGDPELHQGAQQGRAEGDVEDGHLHAAELLRRADLRGDRAQPGVHRPLLHPHDVAGGRRRAST